MTTDTDWAPPRWLHLIIVIVIAAVGFNLMDVIGGWAILVMLGLFLIYALVIVGIQQQKAERAALYEKFRNKLLENPELRDLYDADESRGESS